MPWDPPIDSQVLAIHAALMASGEVLYFGGDEHSKFQHEANDVDNTRLYDPATNIVLEPEEPSSPVGDTFCSGHAHLPDGTLLVAGGTEDFPLPAGEFHHTHFPGLRDSWVYQPLARRWRRVADMNAEPGFPYDGRGGGRWYPTLLTLAGGEVLALGGHPASTDRRPNHNNDSPERYLSSADRWTLLTATAVDCPNYPRAHMLPDGRVFINTPIAGVLRRYDPMTGVFVGASIPRPGDGAYDGFGATSVLLPLLPADGYRPRVLVAGGIQPRRIDLGSAAPSWQDAGFRQGAAAGRRRVHVNAVLLPTGQVFVTGGITPAADNSTPDANAVLAGEIYSPGIDWASGTWTGAESWQSTDPATVARNYHSTALLLPSGKVWTAGSSINGAEGLPSVVGQRRIEVFRPPYDGQPGRPTLTAAPQVIGYGQRFEVRSPQAGAIRRVALIRAGSVTHAFDSDQRYVGLVFSRLTGDRLQVTAPPHGGVAPRGTYMLWILDAAGLPCVRASMVRLSSLRSFVVTDRSTFSVHEVRAQLPPNAAGPAAFPRALYVIYEGFLPTELPGPPTLTFTFDSFAGAAVPGMAATYRSLLLEDPAAPPDTAQRVTFVFDVRFTSAAAFAGFPDRRTVNVRATHGAHTADAALALQQQPNPYMADGPVSWLSTDVRVFQIRPGGAQGGVVHGSAPGAPQTFVSQLLNVYNATPNDEYHPFLDLSQDPEASKLELSRSVGGQRVYNYVIAKVRYRAAAVPAPNVRVFFRGFLTVGTSLEFDVTGSYRRSGSGSNVVPLLGLRGGAMTSIPFFAASRVDTGSASMTTQTDPLNRRTLTPAGAAEHVGYYGAWLDFNQTEPRFPAAPTGNGPWTTRQSIQQLVRGRHMCLVAEVAFGPDPTQPGATPASSDNLSQRNLAIVSSDNPGDPVTHRVQHTFEIRASEPGLGTRAMLEANRYPVAYAAAEPQPVPEPRPDDPPDSDQHAHEDQNEGRPDQADTHRHDPQEQDNPGHENHEHERHGHGDRGYGDHGLGDEARGRLGPPAVAPLDPLDYGPDELLIQWGNLPRTSVATLYLPDVDTDALLETSAGRLGPHVLSRIDDHTIRCAVGDVTYLPLPSGRATTIPGLLSIDLPDTVKADQDFTVTVHQFSGLTKATIGAFQLTIPVRHAPEILDEEIRTLAVMRHIVATMSPGDRWYPVMTRHLNHLEDRVRGLGGHPEQVPPSPNGGPHDQTSCDHDDQDGCRCGCHDLRHLVDELLERMCMDPERTHRILRKATSVARAAVGQIHRPCCSCQSRRT